LSAFLGLVRIIVPLAAGIAVGYFLRGRQPSLDKILSGSILALIFCLGFSIGSNNEFLDALPHVGVASTVLLASAIIFSIAFVKIARRILKI